MNDIYQAISDIKKTGQSAVLCIVTSAKGSTPGKPGMKMIVYEDGTIKGSVGGGSLEKEVTEKARQMIASHAPQFLEFNLKHDLSMECGGSVSVYLEPIVPDLSLLIFGAGHIGKFLSSIAGQFGFSVTVIDEREGIFGDYKRDAIRCINRDFKEAISELEFNNRTYIVIVTHQHINDENILRLVCKKQYAYLGMIGSKTKVATIRKRLVSDGILNLQESEEIDMPIGIRFNTVTHHEVAVSILAKLIDVKNSVES